MLIREKFPNVHVTIINRFKKAKRKKYRMEPNKKAVEFIETYRKMQIQK